MNAGSNATQIQCCVCYVVQAYKLEKQQALVGAMISTVSHRQRHTLCCRRYTWHLSHGTSQEGTSQHSSESCAACKPAMNLGRTPKNVTRLCSIDTKTVCYRSRRWTTQRVIVPRGISHITSCSQARAKCITLGMIDAKSWLHTEQHAGACTRMPNSVGSQLECLTGQLDPKC